MSMFLLEGSSHRSCNLAIECTHVCCLLCVGVCAFLCVGWHVPPEVRVDCRAWCVRVRVRVHAASRTRNHMKAELLNCMQRRSPKRVFGNKNGFAALEAKSDYRSMQRRSPKRVFGNKPLRGPRGQK